MSAIAWRPALLILLGILVGNCGAPVMASAAPAAAAKSRAFEGKIEIDARLARFPKLRALLLAEGKRQLAARRAEADETRRDDPQSFGRSRWTFERSYRLRAAAGHLVSVVSRDVVFTGGAHPNTSIATLLWDSVAGEMTSAFDLFIDARENGPTLRALARLVREALAREKRQHGADVAADPAQDEWLRAVEARTAALGQPSLAPSTSAGKASGITFHFSPYEVGPYAEGPYVAFVSARALAPLLKPEARGLFAGQRPRSDAED